MSSNNYTGEQIEVLRGLEAVRKRPGMYIGNTAERGLHQLVYEAVDNAVDEALAGYATHINVDAAQRRLVSVEDDGRGIPVDIHAEEKLPAVEVVMTILHAGGKFGKGGYKVSGGLHGVGISVVNALSEWMITRVKRDGWLYEMKFERGITVQKLKKVGAHRGNRHDRSGSCPIATMFETLDFHWDILQKRLRELAFLNRGLSITLRDERGDEPRERNYKFEGGIVSFVEWLNEKKDPLHPIISTHAERDGVDVEVAMQYTDTYTDRSSPTPTTSTPSKAACTCRASGTAVTNAVNGYARKRGMLKESDAVALDRRHHGRPHRGRFGEAARPAVRGTDEDQARQRESAQHRLRPGQRASRFLLRRKPEAGARDRRQVHAGAARARSREESARSLAPQERARGLRACPASSSIARTPIRPRARSFSSKAIRPAARPRAAATRTRKRSCRCAARSSTSRRRGSTRCSANEEIRTMITALGTGFGDEFNPDEAALSQDHHHDRRRRRRIAHPHAAADVLLPPDEAAGRARLRLHRAAAALRHSKGQEAVVGVQRGGLQAIIGDADPKDFTIQQYKGLGEMDAEQLAETTMEVGNRRLKQITVEDAVEAEQIFTDLMGDKVEPRKQYIFEYAKSVKSLDL